MPEKDQSRIGETQSHPTDSRTASSVSGNPPVDWPDVSHGSLPWGATTDHAEHAVAIQDAAGADVAYVAFVGTEDALWGIKRAHENVGFMLRAVNSHADLLAALKAIDGEFGRFVSVEDSAVYQLMRAAIAKAEGK